MKIFVSLSAIRLSDYRKWGGHKHFDRNLYKDIFERYSNSKYTKRPSPYRIYLPLLGRGKYEPVSAPKELENFIVSQGYKLEDYSKGIVSKDNGKRLLKIGKLLKNNPELLDLYQKHKAKLGSKDTSDLLVVISRHPYDIAGMSTDRSWTSCTRLGYKGINYKDESEKGINSDYVLDDAKYGYLVTYLINKNDLNIQRPIARARILRYINEESKDWILKMHPKVYGSDTQKFRPTIEAWLKEVNQNPKSGEYRIKGYTDSADTHINIYDEETIINMIEDHDSLFHNIRNIVESESYSQKLHNILVDRVLYLINDLFENDNFMQSAYRSAISGIVQFDPYITEKTLKLIYKEADKYTFLDAVSNSKYLIDNVPNVLDIIGDSPANRTALIRNKNAPDSFLENLFLTLDRTEQRNFLNISGRVPFNVLEYSLKNNIINEENYVNVFHKFSEREVLDLLELKPSVKIIYYLIDSLLETSSTLNSTTVPEILDYIENNATDSDLEDYDIYYNIIQTLDTDLITHEYKLKILTKIANSKFQVAAMTLIRQLKPLLYDTQLILLENMSKHKSAAVREEVSRYIFRSPVFSNLNAHNYEKELLSILNTLKGDSDERVAKITKSVISSIWD